MNFGSDWDREKKRSLLSFCFFLYIKKSSGGIMMSIFYSRLISSHCVDFIVIFIIRDVSHPHIHFGTIGEIWLFSSLTPILFFLLLASVMIEPQL
jgi:hypothetical protein